MTQRTAQLIGFSDGGEITITWNNAEVFRGSVPAAGNRDDLVVLAEWSTDTEIIGDIPLVIECLCDSLHFANIYMNMISPIYEMAPEAEWSRHIPTLEELLADLSVGTDQQLEEKYGHPRNILQQWIVPMIGTENNFKQPIAVHDFTDTDGKLNVTINGVTQTRHSLDRWPGPWHWHLAYGQTLACNFRVDSF